MSDIINYIALQNCYICSKFFKIIIYGTGIRLLIWLYFIEISNTLYVCAACSHEYQIFQKVVKLEYEFPDGFPVHAKDLVTKLLVM